MEMSFVCIVYKFVEHGSLIVSHKSDVFISSVEVICFMYIMIYFLTLFPLHLFASFSTSALRTVQPFLQYRFFFSFSAFPALWFFMCKLKMPIKTDGLYSVIQILRYRLYLLKASFNSLLCNVTHLRWYIVCKLISSH